MVRCHFRQPTYIYTCVLTIATANVRQILFSLVYINIIRECCHRLTVNESKKSFRTYSRCITWSTIYYGNNLHEAILINDMLDNLKFVNVRSRAVFGFIYNFSTCLL